MVSFATTPTEVCCGMWSLYPLGASAGAAGLLHSKPGAAHVYAVSPKLDLLDYGYALAVGPDVAHDR